MKVYRVYVEKRPELANEARASFGAVSAPGGARRAPLRVLCSSGS